jgi:hypothetical protein
MVGKIRLFSIFFLLYSYIPSDPSVKTPDHKLHIAAPAAWLTGGRRGGTSGTRQADYRTACRPSAARNVTSMLLECKAWGAGWYPQLSFINLATL